MREAPAIEIVQHLLDAGATVKAYDPIAMENFRSVVNSPHIHWCSDTLDTAADCDALCLLTEWDAFKEVDLKSVENVMRTPIFIDGGNVFSSEQIAQTHLHYHSIGRPHIQSGGLLTGVTK